MNSLNYNILYKLMYSRLRNRDHSHSHTNLSNSLGKWSSKPLHKGRYNVQRNRYCMHVCKLKYTGPYMLSYNQSRIFLYMNRYMSLRMSWHNLVCNRLYMYRDTNYCNSSRRSYHSSHCIPGHIGLNSLCRNRRYSPHDNCHYNFHYTR